MKTIKTIIDFDSVASLREAVLNESKYSSPSFSNSSHKGTDDKWSGGSWDKAIELSTYGWADGAKKLTKKDFSASPTGVEFKMDTFIDVAGDECDVGRFLSGDPENMIEYTVQENQGKVVRIGFSGCYSCGTSEDTILAKGREIMEAIDSAECEGYRVEVTGEWGCGNGSHHATTRVVLKRAQDQLDIDAIAYMLAHPSSFRRLIFASWEQLPMDQRQALGVTAGGGYGYPVSREGASASYDKWFTVNGR